MEKYIDMYNVYLTKQKKMKNMISEIEELLVRKKTSNKYVIIPGIYIHKYLYLIATQIYTWNKEFHLIQSVNNIRWQRMI